jgi:hypothetical protein
MILDDSYVKRAGAAAATFASAARARTDGAFHKKHLSMMAVMESFP